MRYSVEAILDKLEPRFVKKPARWQKKPPLPWLAPWARLEPAQPYLFNLYLRSTLGLGLAIDIPLFALLLLPFVILECESPGFFREEILHHGREHTAIIHLLVDTSYCWLPLALILIPTVCLLDALPNWYFWNRRATRLSLRAPQLRNNYPTAPTADPTVWPPAPHKPTA